MNKSKDELPSVREVRGSGSDPNSDTERLNNPENFQDKLGEDSFPASDPPSTSPMTGVGHASSDVSQEQRSRVDEWQNE